MNTCKESGIYAYQNPNLFEAVLLRATTPFVVEGKWNNGLMTQVTWPKTMKT